MEIIPAIDVIDGKCVRLTQGDFARRTVYGDDPLQVARRFEAAGIRRLHVVDLDGAKNGKIANLRTLRRVADATDLTIDFGGGIKTEADVRAVFEAGASLACVGSLAVRDPAAFAEWLGIHGPEKFLLGADVRGGKLAIDGWQTDTECGLVSFLSSAPANRVGQVFVTDISKDGLMQGPAVDLYQRILNDLPTIDLIASGGVRSMNDIDALSKIGCSGVIVGKAIYEGRLELEELSAYAG